MSGIGSPALGSQTGGGATTVNQGTSPWVVSGSVAVTSQVPGTGATNLGKKEDDPHSTGDVGVMLLAVRNDNGAVLAGTDGDYLPITTDSSGAVRVDLNGTISTNNSSTSTLLSGATFTGTADDCINYNEIRISVIANVASATDGLSIQQSPDSTNWDITDTYTIAAATGKTFSVPRQARYFRIVYTNGGTNQASFRLQVILNRLGSQASSQRAGDGYTNETDLEQNQTFPMVFNGSTWDRQKSTSTGVMAINVNDGTNSANILKSDGTYAGQNSQIVAGAYLEKTFTTTTAQAVATTEVSNYRWVSVHVVTVGTNSTVTFQGSNDNTNWINVALQNTNATSQPAATSGTGVLLAQGSLGFRYFRLNVTGISAGTTSGVVEFFSEPGQMTTLGVSASQSGTWTVGSNSATGSAVPANAFYQGISDGTNLRGVLGAANSLNSTGAGIPTAQIVAQLDDTSPSTVTENQFGNVRLGPNRALMVMQRSSTAATTSVSSSASNQTLLASNAARVSGSIYNDSTAILYIKFGATASTSSFKVALAANTYYEIPGGYYGQIDGIWASATGAARISEET